MGDAAKESYVKADTAQSPNDSAGELVLGLIGPLGADLGRVTELLEKGFQAYDYEVPPAIHLSRLLPQLSGWKDLSLSPQSLKHEDKRIERLQQAGDQLCTRIERADAMALLGVKEIISTRKSLNGQTNTPRERTVYIIRSIKRAEEVRFLQKLYGPFCLFLSAYAPRESRCQRLATKIAHSHNSTEYQKFRSSAENLICRDESEGNPYGQSVQDAFPLADAFVNANEAATLPKQIERFLSVLFGGPRESPTKDEFGMFLAKAAALRSADLARQVGAVITTNDGDVIAVGTNEVPKPGGGLYWVGDDGDDRDCIRGIDESLEMRKATASELLSLLKESDYLVKDTRTSNIDIMVRELWPQIKKKRLGGIGEFGRTVHAEMAALIDAAKRGASVKGGTLYVTTFPCHNCTRHIIAAGIRRVVYIEPYPKSLAEALHKKAIVVDSANWVEGQVNYEPFVGIAPHSYQGLFGYSAGERRRRIANEGESRAVPRYLGSWHAPIYGPVEEWWVQAFNELLSKGGFST